MYIEGLSELLGMLQLPIEGRDDTGIIKEAVGDP